MEEALAVETATQGAEMMPLVACDPSEMARAQGNLIEWATKMQSATATEVAELTQAHEIAARNRWGSRLALKRQLDRAQNRVVFYAKIEAALRAGYLIVPSFDMDVFAIRTRATTPRGGWQIWSDPGSHRQVAGMLAEGEGQTVSPIPTLDSYSENYVDSKGDDRMRWKYRPVEFGDVDFPLEMARPAIMETTERALSLKLFDEVGIARDHKVGRRGDPMILGRLRNPRANHPDVTFFIAWSLDPRNI